MYLYFTGRYSDIGCVNTLARMIITGIKQLSPVGKAKNSAAHNFADSAKQCILSSLFSLLKKGGESMVNVLRIWRRQKALSDFDQSFLLDVSNSSFSMAKNESTTDIPCYSREIWGPLETEKSLGEMNICWAIWVFLILANVRELLEELFTTSLIALATLATRFKTCMFWFFNPFQNSSEDILKQLNSYGFKPTEDSAEWSDYWKFQKSLEKGDSFVGRGRKIAGAKKQGETCC